MIETMEYGYGPINAPWSWPLQHCGVFTIKLFRHPSFWCQTCTRYASVSCRQKNNRKVLFWMNLQSALISSVWDNIPYCGEQWLHIKFNWRPYWLLSAKFNTWCFADLVGWKVYIKGRWWWHEAGLHQFLSPKVILPRPFKSYLYSSYTHNYPYICYRCYCCQLRPMKSPEANYRCFIYINTSWYTLCCMGALLLSLKC